MTVGKFLYLEFLIPVRDYFCILRLKEWFFEWILPFLISIAAYFFVFPKYSKVLFLDINEQLVNVLAIIIGFTLTSLSLIAAGGSSNLDAKKSTLTEREIDKRPVTVNQLLVVQFVMALILEFVAIALSISLMVLKNAPIISKCSNLINSIGLFLGCVILFMNVKNTTNCYLVFFKK